MDSESEFLAQQVMEGRWETDEHVRFLQAIIQKGKNWKFIQEVVKTRSKTQIRSHAQKFFIKIEQISFERKNNVRKEENGQLHEIQREIQNLFTQRDITPKTPLQLSKIIRNTFNSENIERRKKTTRKKFPKNKSQSTQEKLSFQNIQCKSQVSREREYCEKNCSYFLKLLRFNQQGFKNEQILDCLFKLQIPLSKTLAPDFKKNDNSKSFFLPDQEEDQQKLRERIQILKTRIQL